MGKRVIKVTGLSKAHIAMNASSLFDLKVTVESISAQRMRRIAKKEPAYLMVIRTNEDAGNTAVEETEPTNDDQIVTVNEDATRTDYPIQVQELLNEFSDIFQRVTCRFATAASVGSQDRASTWSRATPQGTLSHVATGVG